MMAKLGCQRDWISNQAEDELPDTFMRDFLDSANCGHILVAAQLQRA